MDQHARETFWNAFHISPIIMMKLDGAPGHAEPMTARLDEEAHHAVWFLCKRGNRIAGGGKAMGQVMTRGHDVFACISGTLTEETDASVREKHWDNAAEAWFPDGKNDSSVVMLRFDIEDSELWITEMGLKGAFKLLTGRPIRPEEAGEHTVGAV